MKRTAFRISLVMLLGVVTSVAVAWGCAWRALSITAQTGPTARIEFFAGSDFFCIGHYAECGFVHLIQSRSRSILARGPWLSPAEYDAMVPSWREPPMTIDEFLAISDANGLVYNQIGAGWPCLCARGSYAVDHATAAGSAVTTRLGNSGVIIVAKDVPGSWRTYIGLPYTPIYSGLLANTAIYGGVWWALLFGPGMFIRWRRRRAGRCVKCGYDLRGLPPDTDCPECGKERQ